MKGTPAAAMWSMFDPGAQSPARCNQQRVDFGEGVKTEYPGKNP